MIGIPAAASTPPTIVRHANVTVDATAPGGAAVSFTVTATDRDGGSRLTVTCSPRSGSTFAAGPRGRSRTWRVTCHAHDAAGNEATPMSFAVTVVGVGTQLAQLEERVAAATVPGAAKAELLALLNEASNDVAWGRRAAARLQLDRFVRRASALSYWARLNWIAAARRAGAALG